MTAENALDMIEFALKRAPLLWEHNLDAPERKVNQAIRDALSIIATYRMVAAQQGLAVGDQSAKRGKA